jgi:hypothetical protein
MKICLRGVSSHPTRCIRSTRTVRPLIDNGRQYVPHAIHLQDIVSNTIPFAQTSHKLVRLLNRYANLLDELSEVIEQTSSEDTNFFAQRNDTCGKQKNKIFMRHWRIRLATLLDFA